MSRGVKILIGIVGFFVLVGVAGVIAFRSMEAGLADLAAAEVEDVDMSTVPDGEYVGTFSRLPVAATVHVTVADHAIVAIEIIEHVNGQGANGEAVVDDIVAANSLAVDAIAGATYSSKAILFAVRDALVNRVPA